MKDENPQSISLADNSMTLKLRLHDYPKNKGWSPLNSMYSDGLVVSKEPSSP